MDCESFAKLLDRFESDALPPAEYGEAAEHLELCARCRRLHQAVRGHAVPEAGEPPPELVVSILQQTSGPVCGSAMDRLCDWVDGGLDGNERQILSLHLEHCESCSALVSSLVELRQVLPEMAALEPDSDFAGQVLQATLSHGGHTGRRPVYLDRHGWWRALFRRPRIAWEAAYVGALLILLFIGNAPLPLTYFQSATLVPAQIMQSSNRLIDSATGSLAERRQSAILAFKELQLEGRSVMEEAIALQLRTRRAIRERSTAFLEALQSEFRNTENPDLP